MSAIEPSVDAEQGATPSVDAEQVSETAAGTAPESIQENTTPEQGESPSVDGGKPKGAEGYAARQRYLAAQAKREADEARAENERLRRELAEAKLPKEPTVPPMPDQFDDDFQGKLEAREAALAEKARYEAERKAYETETQRLEQERQQREYAEQQRVQQERESEYVQRIQVSGLSSDEVTAHLGKLQQDHPQMPEPMRQALIADPDSPLIAKFLVENPEEAYALYGMDAYSGMVHIATAIKQKALQLKPKPTSAPPVPDALDGGGFTQEEDPYLKGATFS